MGGSVAAASALLLYTTHGFLGSAGFLIALALAAIALGLWVGVETVSPARRLLAAIVGYGVAALFAIFWAADAGFRKAPLGGALAAFFLLAGPAYTSAAAYQAFARRGNAVHAFFGAAAGVLLSALILIPRVQPGVIFLLAAAVLLVVSLLATRRNSASMDQDGLSLHGKTAIVTGVGDAGQVGYAVAEALVHAGAKVCVTARTQAVQELATQLGAVGVAADLTMEEDVARLAAAARSALGHIDILVNVAGGLSVIKPLAETTTAEWQREVQRNAETVFLVCRALLPDLRTARGRIINFASPAGERAVAQLGAYSAAKAAVIALTRALAIEEKAHGLCVNAIAPGMIDTEQNRQQNSDPNTKWVTREQIAQTVLFLASDAASGITGETIQVLGEGIA